MNALGRCTHLLVIAKRVNFYWSLLVIGRALWIGLFSSWPTFAILILLRSFESHLPAVHRQPWFSIRGRTRRSRSRECFEASLRRIQRKLQPHTPHATPCRRSSVTSFASASRASRACCRMWQPKANHDRIAPISTISAHLITTRPGHRSTRWICMRFNWTVKVRMIRAFREENLFTKQTFSSKNLSGVL